MSLLQHADEERFRLSAAGLFHVGTHLLPAVNKKIIHYFVSEIILSVYSGDILFLKVTGSIVTYLVILLQYQFNKWIIYNSTGGLASRKPLKI